MARDSDRVQALEDEVRALVRLLRMEREIARKENVELIRVTAELEEARQRAQNLEDRVLELEGALETVNR